jgi:hypothetical protein
MMNEESHFEVTDHFEIEDRGAFVIGHIRGDDPINIGMVVDTQEPEKMFTISGIEFVDNIREKKYWNALVFQEKPTLDTVKRCFPVGTHLKPKERNSQQQRAFIPRSRD